MHTLNLTGDMARYIWSINNISWDKDIPPLPIAKDERVELVMVVNQTRMPHPMHLDRHEFQVPRDRREAVFRRDARHRAGDAGTACRSGFRRQQPGAMGLPLPSAVSSRRRYVHNISVCLMPSTFGLWGDSLDHLVHLLLAFARLGPLF
jgi:hypothetical protein